MKKKALKEAKRIHDELSQIDIIVSHVKRDWNEVFKLTFFTLRFLRSLRETENLVNPCLPRGTRGKSCQRYSASLRSLPVGA